MEMPEDLKEIVGLEKLQTKLDYGKDENWVAKPTEITKAVDVFFIYPTVTGVREPVQICDVNDPMMVAGAGLCRQTQAAVFDESCNVFVPYYRQTSMPKPRADFMAIVNYLSGFDATNALDYYLNNLNGGRPFILAGHSQGSSTLLCLLKNYMLKHPEYLKRMVAAYPIGFAVTKGWLKETGFKFAEGASDTGVIVSWNTEGEGNKDSVSEVLAPGGLSINPINWKRDDTYAPASENICSIDFGAMEFFMATAGDPSVSLNPDKMFVTPGIADARVDTVRGSVVVTSVSDKKERYAIPEFAHAIFGPENYHLNDYGFFFGNLRKNVVDRIEAFMRKEGK